MAISLYDTEEVTPVQTIEEIKREKQKEKPEVISKVKNAKAPPSMGEAFQTFLSDIGANHLTILFQMHLLLLRII